MGCIVDLAYGCKQAVELNERCRPYNWIVQVVISEFVITPAESKFVDVWKKI